jgi:hypothetical protein
MSLAPQLLLQFTLRVSCLAAYCIASGEFLHALPIPVPEHMVAGAVLIVSN